MMQGTVYTNRRRWPHGGQAPSVPAAAAEYVLPQHRRAPGPAYRVLNAPVTDLATAIIKRILVPCDVKGAVLALLNSDYPQYRVQVSYLRHILRSLSARYHAIKDEKAPEPFCLEDFQHQALNPKDRKPPDIENHELQNIRSRVLQDVALNSDVDARQMTEIILDIFAEQHDRSYVKIADVQKLCEEVMRLRYHQLPARQPCASTTLASPPTSLSGAMASLCLHEPSAQLTRQSHAVTAPLAARARATTLEPCRPPTQGFAQPELARIFAGQDAKDTLTVWTVGAVRARLSQGATDIQRSAIEALASEKGNDLISFADYLEVLQRVEHLLINKQSQGPTIASGAPVPQAVQYYAPAVHGHALAMNQAVTPGFVLAFASNSAVEPMYHINPSFYYGC
jgi:hypothetical protein